MSGPTEGTSSLEDKISDQVLIKSVQAYLNEELEVKIIKKNIKLATKPGDNYVSFVYQVGVTYIIGNDDSSPFDIQFIVKCIQDSEIFQDLVRESKVFEKEKLMYETILPALEASSGLTFAPKCYFIQEEGTQKLMVFNDLKDLGYQMVDRKKGMDFPHCKLLLERLAAFHAASLVFMMDNEQPLELLNQGMSADPILVEFVFKSFLTNLIKVAHGWEEPELKGIVDQLEKVLSNYWEVYKQPMKTEGEVFRVINHGDAWCNNFMFNYNGNGEPIDVILLDHQMPFYSSPGYDLNYFMITSPDMDTRLNREKDLLKIYREAFNAKLTELGFEDFHLTEEKLREAYKQKSIFGFTMMLTIMPLIMRTVPEEGESQDKEKNMQNMQKALFANEDFIAILKYSLMKFHKLGTFDLLP